MIDVRIGGHDMEIYNASSTLTPVAAATFARPPQRVVLLPGEELFRLGTIQGPSFRGNDTFGSPWWIPTSTYRLIAKTAHRTGTSIIDVSRSRLAVAPAWNPAMDWLMVIVLKKAVQAWVGPARPQPMSDGDRSVMLLGFYDQAFVPGLAPPESMSSEAAMLTYYGSVGV